MKFVNVFLLAALPVLATGCGDTSPAANPKLADPARHAINPVTRPAADNVGPVDARGKPRSLTAEN